MAKITVYHFRGFSITTNQFHVPPSMATIEFISKHNYDALKETAIEIDESKLDGNGLYFPPKQEGKY